MESLTLTEGTQTAIEQNTRGQADNPLWFDLHNCLKIYQSSGMFEAILQILHSVNWGDGNDQAEITKL